MHHISKYLVTALIIVMGATTVFAQPDKKDWSITDAGRNLIQFSGVVVTGDSLQPVPFVNIIDKVTHRGTTTDYYGYFSFVAQEGDTVIFSSIGFKRSNFVIPDSLADNRYSLIHLMYSDTILLNETHIFPWPSRDQFADAFVNMEIPYDNLALAQQNLTREALREHYENMPMDASMNYKWQMQQQQTKLYYAGQAPPINLLNPIAWAQFIKAWKDGDFKRKDK
jgi:hypothetical protein